MRRCTSIYREDYRWWEYKPRHPYDRSELCCEIAAPEPPPPPPPPPCLPRESRKPAIQEGSCPLAEDLRFDDTDACLKKLFRKSPELLKLMKTKPSLDGLKKFNRDRLTSTYQCDFGHQGVQPVDFDGWPTKRIPCPLDEYEPPLYDCRVNKRHPSAILRAKLGLPSRVTTEPCRRGRLSGVKDGDFNSLAAVAPKPKRIVIPPAKFSRWNTEYKDSINRPGNLIMKLMSKKPEMFKDDGAHEAWLKMINKKTAIW